MSPNHFILDSSSSSSSAFPSYISGVHHFWVRFLRMWPFFNPTNKVVTFRLCGWCVLGVFLLLDMNVRIFWVRAMKCMCAQTRPRFILSSERVFGGMEFEPMLTSGEKSPLPENFPRGILDSILFILWPVWPYTLHRAASLFLGFFYHKLAFYPKWVPQIWKKKIAQHLWIYYEHKSLTCINIWLNTENLNLPSFFLYDSIVASYLAWKKITNWMWSQTLSKQTTEIWNVLLIKSSSCKNTTLQSTHTYGLSCHHLCKRGHGFDLTIVNNTQSTFSLVFNF